MTRAIWFNCFSGIAGDMALGALLNAGADLDYVNEVLCRLDVQGWSIQPQVVNKSGLFATYADVRTTDDPDHERTWASIRSLLQQNDLPERVRNRALKIFAALAQAEASAHHIAIDDVHFHEVGGVDAIIDIVGTCAALESLAVDRVYCSPVTVGTGTVQSAHGTLSNPAPATVELLKGALIKGSDHPFELTTPTGAAIVSALSEAFGGAPVMRAESTGYGAGTRDIDGMPNCVQVLIGELSEPAEPPNTDALVMLETNVDDVTGEVLAHVISRLMDAGARDAWISPILMKKGRPAHTISVLTTVDLTAGLVAMIQNETGSLGVRSWSVDRHAQTRRVEYVEVEGEAVRVKVSDVRTKAEFEDALIVATAKNRPVREILSEAEQLWKRSQ